MLLALSDEQSNALIQNKSKGEMKDDKKHGKGKMKYANGNNYTGDWVDDIITGQGILIFANGDRYEIKSSQPLRSRCI
jgi:hypothetical protein